MKKDFSVFRAKTKDDEDWVRGIYCPYTWNFDGKRINAPQIIIISDDTKKDGFWCTVVEETVGQYTGTNDKNKKEIFEGDIIKAYLHGDLEMVFPVTFRSGCFWFGNWNWIEFLDKFRKAEVIGNIFDAPELLKGDDNNG